MALKILALGGDGIGPEVLNAGLKLLAAVASSAAIKYELCEDLLHGAAWDKHGTFLHPDTLAKARESDALLVGATGGPAWDRIEVAGGPAEQDGLMKLRHELQTFACVRSSQAWEPLLDYTPFNPDVVRGANVIVMRELCGGAMFSDTRGIETGSDGKRRGFDLNEYAESEIARFARVGFTIARQRKKRVVSVDKSNVFVADKLWREVVTEVSTDFPDIELTHMFADNCAFQLCRQPASFDVILADNLFGDILSDQVGSIAGSLGMLPSASLPGIDANGVSNGTAIYEPVHGSAPDIAGHGVANPIGMILSVAMMFEYSLGRTDISKKISAAVEAALKEGFATRDIGGKATTSAMTDAIIRHYQSP
ncbi:MAG: 3-isopropylmalate dehydrogenase [Pseudomonadota bacterium]